MPTTPATETFFVEDATDDDGTGTPRPVVHTGAHYFPALDAFREVARAHPGRRYVLSVGTENRVRALSASDTDNVLRLSAGLLPVWQIPGESYADAAGTATREA